MISIRNDIDTSENDNVICCNYEIKNNYVIKIDFEMMTAPAEENAVVKIDRGYSFYTYIKNNKNLSQNRRDQLTHMLPLSQIIWDKPVFFYQSLVDAIHIRRAEIWRQVTLINTLKAYNPFYHVQGNMPYLIYYYKYYNKDLKHVVQNEIINVVLNMRTIEDVEHIYLHSHYKYYVSVNELVKIIKERRPELLPFTFNIFSNESLVCIIDREGNIINSFFDQESVHLSQINHSANEYIVYMCSFSVEPDGIKVKNCENVDSFYQALTCIISCIISGKVNMEKAIGLFEGILNELFSKNGLTELVKECNLFPKTSIILHDLLITIRNMDQLNKKIENIDWKKIFHALRYLSQVDDLSSEEEICTVLWNLLSKEEVRGENKSNDTKDDIVQTVKKEKADNQFMNQVKVHEIQRKQELYCIEKERFVIRPNKSILNILRLKPRTLNLINAYKRIANSLDNDIDFHLEEDNELLLSCFSKDPRFFISCYRKAFLIRMNNIMLIMDLIEKTKEISPFYSTDRCDDYICGCALFAEIAEKYAICEEFKEVIKAASNFNDILYIYIHSFYKYSMTVDKLLKAVKSLRTDMVLDSAPCFDNAIFPFITDGERRLRSPSFSSFYLDNAVMVEPLHLYYASFSIRNGNYTCISHERVDNVTVLFIAICVCIANQPSEVDSLLSIMKEMGDSLEERSQMQMNEISMLPISLPLIRKTCNMVKEFGGKNIEKSIKWNKIRKEFTKQDETRIIKLIDLPRKFQQVNTDIGFLVGELIGLSNNCTVLDDVGKMLEDNQIKQTRKMTLKEMKLSDDTCDVLSNAGFSFSSEIINMSTKELVSIPHIEIESVVEIQNWKKNQKKEQRNTTYAKINTGLTPNDYFWIDPDFFFDLFEQSMHIRTNDYRYQRQYIEYLDVQNIFTYSRIFWNYQMHYVGVMDRTKKEGIIDDFIRILGSISSVEQIVEIYMNSHYKFYFSINELKDLINRYRNDLCPYNISSFQVYGFFGVVDNRGVLWNPFFSPETLRIGKAACGTVYLFRVRVTSNEIVIANQEEINCAVYGLVIVLSCLCLGWNISDSTRDLLRLLSNSVFTGSTVYDGFKPYLEPIDCDTIITRANELYNLADISPQIPISLFERYRNTKETLKRRKL